MVYEQDDDTGTVALFINGAEVGRGTVATVVRGKFSISGPFDVGLNNGGSVERRAYKSSFRFNGQLDRVEFDLKPIEQVAQTTVLNAKAEQRAID